MNGEKRAIKAPLAGAITLSVAALSVVCGTAAPALAADPTTADCLASSDASLTLARQHKLRAERAQLLVCAAPSCPGDIAKECARRVDEVNAQIPTVAFFAKDASTGADLGAVKVTMDGELLADRLEGTALSIDPGEHTFTFETAGQPPVTRKLLVVEGQKDRHEQVVFGTPPPAPVAAVTPAPPPPSGVGTQKVLAIVAAGVGVAGLGVGTAFGVLALSAKSDAQRLCPDRCSTQEGVDKWSDAATKGNVSTIGLAAGGVLLAGGVVLWFTAPRSAGTQVGLGPQGVEVKGTW